MDRYEYLEKKAAGELLADDADLHSEEARKIEIVDELEELVEEQQQEETPEDEPETPVEPPEDGEEDELPELSEKEKTAFEKRMERERKKLEEKYQQEYEQKYGRHKQVVELLGGDPDEIEKRIRDNQLAQQANRLAEQNGWDEEQTRWYMEQEKQKHELAELRVQVQINKLKDNPDYAGITSIESDIKKKIEQTNGLLSVEEAFWALGGPKRAEQIKLEAQMREQAKRTKQPRTVLTDAPTSTAGDKPLPPEVAKEAERMGISASEARRLMNSEPSGSIDEYRKRKAK